jgi:hypothetical protein
MQDVLMVLVEQVDDHYLCVDWLAGGRLNYAGCL